jgi:hypothetical protein
MHIFPFQKLKIETDASNIHLSDKQKSFFMVLKTIRISIIQLEEKGVEFLRHSTCLPLMFLSFLRPVASLLYFNQRTRLAVICL